MRSRATTSMPTPLTTCVKPSLKDSAKKVLMAHLQGIRQGWGCPDEVAALLNDYTLAKATGLLPHELDEKLTLHDMQVYRAGLMYESISGGK